MDMVYIYFKLMISRGSPTGKDTVLNNRVNDVFPCHHRIKQHEHHYSPSLISSSVHECTLVPCQKRWKRVPVSPVYQEEETGINKPLHTCVYHYFMYFMFYCLPDSCPCNVYLSCLPRQMLLFICCCWCHPPTHDIINYTFTISLSLSLQCIDLCSSLLLSLF